MALKDSARLQRRAARIWVSHACPVDASLGPIVPRVRPRKLTVGYFSADLRAAPVQVNYLGFNTHYKISPQTFAGWMRILQAVPGSVLLLYADQEATMNNLRAQAVRHGVLANRLVFGERLPPPQYLARYRSADLFLDTFPYNAGTTASDALWAGLPVLTLTGEAFASRLAAIRTRIQDNRLTSPLFDTPLFTRNLEAAYTAIQDRYQSGLAPDHIRF